MCDLSVSGSCELGLILGIILRSVRVLVCVIVKHFEQPWTVSLNFRACKLWLLSCSLVVWLFTSTNKIIKNDFLKGQFKKSIDLCII